MTGIGGRPEVILEGGKLTLELGNMMELYGFTIPSNIRLTETELRMPYTRHMTVTEVLREKNVSTGGRPS